MGKSGMIKCKEGLINIDGNDVETLADLACIVKAIQTDSVEKGVRPVLSALRILKYVVIGLTYRGEG